jgi:hypothetical protein
MAFSLQSDEDLEEDPNGPSFDSLIKAQVILPHKEGDMIAVVTNESGMRTGTWLGEITGFRG